MEAELGAKTEVRGRGREEVREATERGKEKDWEGEEESVWS
jgi:hypothetical protein